MSTTLIDYRQLTYFLLTCYCKRTD